MSMSKCTKLVVEVIQNSMSSIRQQVSPVSGRIATQLPRGGTALLLLVGLTPVFSGAERVWAQPAGPVSVCHVSSDNPLEFRTMRVNEAAAAAHIKHGDLPGACGEHCAILCDDGDACTLDLCDNAVEGCADEHPETDCDDNNACTADACDASTGCVYDFFCECPVGTALCDFACESESMLERIPVPIENGSFEVGPPVGADTRLSTGSSAIPGWTVLQTIDYIGSYYPSADGSHSIDLDGLTPGAIQQTVAVLPNHTYLVDFAIAGNPGCCSSVKPLEVIVAGQVFAFEFDTTGKTLSSPGWERRSFTFVSDDENIELIFASRNIVDNIGAGPAIDDVQVFELICPE